MSYAKDGKAQFLGQSMPLGISKLIWLFIKNAVLIMKFEWDSEKERISIQKHEITFDQAAYVFADPFALNKYDDEHSEEEDR